MLIYYRGDFNYNNPDGCVMPVETPYDILDICKPEGMEKLKVILEDHDRSKVLDLVFLKGYKHSGPTLDTPLEERREAFGRLAETISIETKHTKNTLLYMREYAQTHNFSIRFAFHHDEVNKFTKEPIATIFIVDTVYELIKHRDSGICNSIKPSANEPILRVKNEPTN